MKFIYLEIAQIWHAGCFLPGSIPGSAISKKQKTGGKKWVKEFLFCS